MQSKISMHQVTVICSRHDEIGNCNSSQLLRIVERIRPDVIFEELSYSNFEKSYTHEKLVTLETNTIKQYRTTHKIRQVPIDTFPRTREYDESLSQLYSCLTNGGTYHMK